MHERLASKDTCPRKPDAGADCKLVGFRDARLHRANGSAGKTRSSASASASRRNAWFSNEIMERIKPVASWRPEGPVEAELRAVVEEDGINIVEACLGESLDGLQDLDRAGCTGELSASALMGPRTSC